MDDYGRLVSWNSPNVDHSVVLLKVRVIHMRLIPKSIVIRQLGGDRACWTAAVYILHGADSNAHDPEVTTADEEPPPTNGVPHPMFEEGLTAEQLYQQQLQNWLLQNGVGNDQAPHHAPQQDGPQEAQWDPWPQPSAAQIASCPG